MSDQIFKEFLTAAERDGVTHFKLPARQTPMEMVLAAHPRARCTGGYTGPESWVIHEFCPGGIVEPQVLGRGKSGSAAWRNAANNLSGADDAKAGTHAPIDY